MKDDAMTQAENLTHEATCLPDHQMANGLPYTLNFFINEDRCGANLKQLYGKNFKRAMEFYSRFYNQETKSRLKSMRRKGIPHDLALAVNLSDYPIRQKALAHVNRNKQDYPYLLEVACMKPYESAINNIEPANIKEEAEKVTQRWPWLSYFRTILEENSFRPHKTNDDNMVLSAGLMMDQIARWNELSEKEKSEVELGLFSISSLSDSRIPMDAAIFYEPECLDRYACLQWSDSDHIERFLDGTVPTYQENYCCTQGNLFGSYVLDNGELHPDIKMYCRVVEFIGKMPDVESLYHANNIEYETRSLFRDIQEMSTQAQQQLLEDTRSELANSKRDIESYLENGLETLGADNVKRIRSALAPWQKLTIPEEMAPNQYAILVDIKSGAIGTSKLMDILRVAGQAYEEELARLTKKISDLTSEPSHAANNIQDIQSVTAEMEEAKSTYEGSFIAFLEDYPPPPVVPVPIWPTEEQDPHEAQENERRIMQLEIDDLKEKLDLAKQERSEALTRVHNLETNNSTTMNTVAANGMPHDAMKALAQQKATPRQVLEIIACEYDAEQIVVLDSACKSADKCAAFKNGARLYELLSTLASDYRQALIDGTPDAEARKLFAGSFRAGESDTVTKNPKLARMREFDYEGEKVPMMTHLALGVTKQKENTIRVHFYWDSVRQRIAVGYCGEHLQTATS